MKYAYKELCDNEVVDIMKKFIAHPEWANDRSQAAGEVEAKRENRCIDRFARLLSRF